MEHFNTITKLPGMKDQNITIKDIIDCQTHKEIIASLDYDAPDCSHCRGKMTKY
ncbi:ISL3 family transposase, partial [Streptococcus alactolyticus]